MPFDLYNAPSTFQATMNDTLRPFLQKFIVVFLDDILVYIPFFPSHVKHLEAVLSSLSQGQFLLWKSQCVFAKNQLNYLGHIVSTQGVSQTLTKIQAMLDWPILATPTDLHWFLILTWFYRKFIQGYATVPAPLTALLCKDQFCWSLEAQHAFQHLKHLRTQAPILATLDFFVPFTLETDGSGMAMGKVLL